MAEVYWQQGRNLKIPTDVEEKRSEWTHIDMTDSQSLASRFKSQPENVDGDPSWIFVEDIHKTTNPL